LNKRGSPEEAPNARKGLAPQGKKTTYPGQMKETPGQDRLAEGLLVQNTPGNNITSSIVKLGGEGGY